MTSAGRVSVLPGSSGKRRLPWGFCSVGFGRFVEPGLWSLALVVGTWSCDTGKTLSGPQAAKGEPGIYAPSCSDVERWRPNGSAPPGMEGMGFQEPTELFPTISGDGYSEASVSRPCFKAFLLETSLSLNLTEVILN